MNFFAHALIAARRREEPAWILGSMLPDFASMAGLRLRDVVARPRLGELLTAGVAFHHACDDAFHGAPLFLQLESDARDELEARGVGIGAAMAIGHVGVELLLDGWLVGQHGVPDHYRAATAIADEAGPDLLWHDVGADGQERWRAMCHRLAHAPLPEGYANPDFVAERLIRILSYRPRLAVDPGREHEVYAWTRRSMAPVAAKAAELLEQVESRLARAS